MRDGKESSARLLLPLLPLSLSLSLSISLSLPFSLSPVESRRRRRGSEDKVAAWRRVCLEQTHSCLSHTHSCFSLTHSLLLSKFANPESVFFTIRLCLHDHHSVKSLYSIQFQTIFFLSSLWPSSIGCVCFDTLEYKS